MGCLFSDGSRIVPLTTNTLNFLFVLPVREIREMQHDAKSGHDFLQLKVVSKVGD